jgi:hypothetical protein
MLRMTLLVSLFAVAVVGPAWAGDPPIAAVDDLGGHRGNYGYDGPGFGYGYRNLSPLGQHRGDYKISPGFGYGYARDLDYYQPLSRGDGYVPPPRVDPQQYYKNLRTQPGMTPFKSGPGTLATPLGQPTRSFRF